MHFFKKGKIHVLILEIGEDLIEKVIEYCRKNDIEAAYVSGIGAIGNPEIGYFDRNKKEYLRKKLNGSFELVNLTGNISIKEGKIIFHPHVTLGGPDYNLTGGHLFEGKISVTGEIFILPLEGQLTRTKDKTTGLDLIEKSG